MKPLLKLLAMLAIFLFAVAGPMNRLTEGSDIDIKQLMGKNFSYLQNILVDLIVSDYTTIAHDVEVIENHAQSLSVVVPANAASNREMFLSMALNLKVHANHLRQITEILKGRDGKPEQDGLLKIDYLRNSAAAHFGQMVTTCVACHNQFRRRVVK